MRETAAQALGAALQQLAVDVLAAALAMLRQLTGQADWEVRHGGLLGLKYLLAARQDAAEQLLPLALPGAVVGLQVRAHHSNTHPSSRMKELCRW